MMHLVHVPPVRMAPADSCNTPRSDGGAGPVNRTIRERNA